MRYIFAALAALSAIQEGSATPFSCKPNTQNVFIARRSPGREAGCWLKWSGWSECVGTCGKGVKTAMRKCMTESGFAIPENTVGCDGSEIKRRSCSDSSMVMKTDSCAYWSYWSEWSQCETDKHYCDVDNRMGQRKRQRFCNDPDALLRGVEMTPEEMSENRHPRLATPWLGNGGPKRSATHPRRAAAGS